MSQLLEAFTGNKKASPKQPPNQHKPDAHAQPAPQEARGAKGKAKADQPSNKHQQQLPVQTEEQGLIQALQRLVTRAPKQPGTPLQRLVELVESAQKGHRLHRKRRPKSEQSTANTTLGTHEQPAKKQKRDDDIRSNCQEKGKGFGAKTLPKARTWAEVATGDAPTSKGKGKKGGKKGKELSQPDAHPHSKAGAAKAHPAPLKSAWSSRALVENQAALKALEDGRMPSGTACVCHTAAQIQDLVRLAKLHQLTSAPYALILSKEA